jgi:hypothetical protein
MATRMQQRRGTAAQWTGANPTLAAGEIGYETDTGKFKIGNGSSQWSALNYYVDANAILDGAPGVLDTLNELAAALGDDPAFITTVGTNLSNHTNATTSVHGIADTADLATQQFVTDAVSNAEVDQSTLAGTGIDWNSGTEQFDIDSTVVTLTGTQTLSNKTLSSPQINGATIDTDSVAVTQIGADNSTKIATTAFVQNRISTLINSSPSALDTLNELATALGNDENFATTVTNSIATKLSKSGDTMTGDLTLAGAPSADLHAATKKYVDDEIGSTETTLGNNLITHENATTNVHGIDDTSALATKSYADNALSTHASDSTDVHGIANTADLATKSYADNALSTHASDSTNVHGIDNTADLATKAYADNALSTHSSDTTDVHGIVDTSELATKAYADAAATHNAVTTDVHGISNTANLVVTSDARLSDTRTPTDNTVTTAKIVDSNVTADKLAGDAVTTAKILDGAVTEAKLASNSVTSGKIADGTIVNADISATAAIDWTKLAVSSTVSATELGYVDGVTSAIQGQLDAKLASATAASTYAPIASPTFTGTVSGISKSMVGLGNVDNTSDANKPVSTATQTALDAKLSLAGGTMTGALTLSGAPTQDAHAATKAYVDNVTAGINFHQPVRVATTGNITRSGTQTIDGVSLSVGDRVLVKDQTTQTENGIYVVASGSWTRATDADNTPDGELKGGDFTLVLEGTVNSGYGYVCSNTSAITIGTTNVTYSAFNAAKAVTAGTGLTETTPGTLAVDSSTVQYRVSGVSDTEIGYLDGVTSAIQTQLDAKAPIASPTFTGTVTVAASGIAFTDGTQTKEGVPSRTTISQKTDSYTLSSLTERDTLIEMGKSTAQTLTIPTDATLNFPVGTSIDILQTGAGQVTIAAATPATTTVNGTPGLKLRTQWSSATLLKRAANTWVVMGDLSA